MIMTVARRLLLPVGWIMWWLIQVAVKLPVALLGLFVLPFMYIYRVNTLAQMKENVPWLMPWVNPEDWTGGHLNNTDALPEWWKKRMGDGFWAFYKYHAIRNPADGLRNFPKWNLKINRTKVNFWTPRYYDHYDPWFIRKKKPGFTGVIGYAAWQGIWLGIKVQWYRKNSYSEFKLGFRVEPRDAYQELDDNSARKRYGASFASKLIPNREL